MNKSTPTYPNNTADEDDIIQQLNDKMARLHAPATVYISVLMVLGFIGNSMVIYYYGLKSKRTTNNLFIVTLALYDIIVCVICMPTEIADIVLYYTFENNVACKALRFVNYFAGIASILTLVAIAADRFRKICKPMRPQMTMKSAKLVSACVVAVSILLSWPALVIYGSIRVHIPHSSGTDLRGSDCTSTKDLKYRKYVWAFNGIHFLLFIVCSMALIVLYSIIGKTILTHKKKMQGLRMSKKSTHSLSVSEETSFSSDLAKKPSKDGCSDKAVNATNEAAVKSTVSIDNNALAGNSRVRGNNETVKSVKSSNRKNTRKSTGNIDSESVKITLIMIIVTMVFIISFLPYLSLTVWRVAKGKHEAEFLTGSGLVMFKIGSRSFLLNNSLNPWIYGIFNSAFREFFFGRLFQKCCRK